MKFATKAIHAAQSPEKSTGSVIVPIYQTSTYAQPEPGKEGAYVYSRTANPTRTALEESLAVLENGKWGLAFSSGMAATTTILMLLKRGDHVVAADDVYGGTYRLFEQVLRNFGMSFTYVDARDTDKIESAIRKNTRMIWIETPTNPLMKIVDIGKTARIAHRAEALTVVDNTFMSPYFQNPLDHGADITVHSTTKYLGGHSDLIGGATVTSDRKVQDQLKFLQNAVGAVPGPMDCWLVLRGIKTLAVRMERHDSNAARIAEFLQKESQVEHVYYPGSNGNNREKEIIKRQMNGHGGGMISFDLKGGMRASKRLLGKLRVFTLAESLGGVESLIEHPASMTHASVPAKVRQERGIGDGLIRISTGIEDVEDLLADLRNGFRAI